MLYVIRQLPTAGPTSSQRSGLSVFWLAVPRPRDRSSVLGLPSVREHIVYRPALLMACGLPRFAQIDDRRPHLQHPQPAVAGAIRTERNTRIPRSAQIRGRERNAW